MDIIAEVEPELSYPQPNQIFRNLGGKGFSETSAGLGTGLEVVAVSRAAAAADCDNDGDQDLLVTNVSGPPTLLVTKGATATTGSSSSSSGPGTATPSGPG